MSCCSARNALRLSMFGDTFFWFIEIVAKLLDGLRLSGEKMKKLIV